MSHGRMMNQNLETMKTKLNGLMSEAHFLAGENAEGMNVVLEPTTEPRQEVITALSDRAAAGFITDFSESRFEHPDEIPALTAPTPVRALAGYAVSFRTGTELRRIAAAGDRSAEAEFEAKSVTFSAPAAKTTSVFSSTPMVHRDDILAAIRAAGVKQGDVLLVHSSLKAFGRVEGGAAAMIEAVMEAIGPDGMFFVPTFQRSECFLGGRISRRWDHRPSDAANRSSAAVKWVGTVPLEFMRLYPDAPRGRHISHSWAGWGRGAAELLARQAWDEPPFSDNSVPGIVKEMANAKILHLGSPVGHTSFVHHFENHYRLPGLGPAYYEVRLPDGGIGWKYVPDLVPGPREFYTRDENARFFRECFARGLRLNTVPLGNGFVKVLDDCRTFWVVGSELVKREPSIIIGDCGPY